MAHGALGGSPPDRDILELPATVVVPCRPVAFQEDSSTQAAAKAAAKDDMPKPLVVKVLVEVVLILMLSFLLVALVNWICK